MERSPKDRKKKLNHIENLVMDFIYSINNEWVNIVKYFSVIPDKESSIWRMP